MMTGWPQTLCRKIKHYAHAVVSTLISDTISPSRDNEAMLLLPALFSLFALFAILLLFLVVLLLLFFSFKLILLEGNSYEFCRRRANGLASRFRLYDSGLPKNDTRVVDCSFSLLFC